MFRMKRIYETLLAEHIRENRQMAFLTGPRQVGKTTSALACSPMPHYLNWDRQTDRTDIIRGPDAVAQKAGLSTLQTMHPVIVLDEIHKYSKWKNFLKGFFDSYGSSCHAIVTGSSRLNIYKRGGDSLMGRYFPYRMHPLSVSELVSTDIIETEIRTAPMRIDKDAWESLLRFGGFPEPFLKGNTRFHNKWILLRTEQLFREDLRDLTRVRETGQIQTLAELVAAHSGQPVNLSNLAVAANVSVDTIRRWIALLESFHFCFTVRPWFRNVSKALRKQPKLFLWDWSVLKDPGARFENFVASHLLKAVHWWTDTGLGKYALNYVRDKNGREVDFLVVRDGAPWFLVEVKSSAKRELNPCLALFQRQTKARHAFQIAGDLDYVERDCFSATTPVRVPAMTFLSQLM